MGHGLNPKLMVALAIIVPYLLGVLVSSKVIPADFFHKNNDVEATMDTSRKMKEAQHDVHSDAGTNMGDNVVIHADFDVQFADIMKVKEKGDPFAGLSFVVHRNGEPEPCGRSVTDNIYESLRQTLHYDDQQPKDFDQYDFESFLTLAFAHSILSHDMCPSKERTNNGSKVGIFSFCDMGVDKTPVLLDHDRLVPVTWADGRTESLPCHFHTREGVRVTSFEQLAEFARGATEKAAAEAEQVCANGKEGDTDETCVAKEPELHLYAVPAGRVFMFAPSYVGEIFELPHVKVADGLPVSLEVLSLRPRVFDIYNFYNREESAEIVKRALAETSESHRIKRSSTGASGYNLNSKRTSENGFDTHGKTSIEVKKRCFKVLGFDQYLEGHADGLQVLRYNKTTAYTPHMDWIDDVGKKEEFNFDSAGIGGNRFATILLYMSDLREGDGGETVFTNGWPVGQPEEEHVPLHEALRQLRESGDASILARGSWEEEMVAQCRSRLAIRPHSSRAVLFYSQHPNGEPDNDSLHGGCPVLDGEKWAANLWVWNTPRGGYPGAPMNQDVVERNRKSGKKVVEPGQLHAVFKNSGNNPKFAKADLYFQETYWGPFSHGDPPLSVNTYKGHEWNVMVDGKVAERWIITDEEEQFYEI